jgi:hypothetical protein
MMERIVDGIRFDVTVPEFHMIAPLRLNWVAVTESLLFLSFWKHNK